MNGILPPAPMAPGQGGPFEGVQMGEPIHMDDYNGPPHHDNFGPYRAGSPDRFFNYDADSDGKGKKGKKNKGGGQNRSFVQVQYEGVILEKADPRPGEKTSWARVGKRPLPLGDKKLQEIVKLHRLKTRQSPQRDLEQLSSNQHGIVNRLIEERQQKEKDKNAVWILADVQRMGKWGWTSMEVKKIQVILKRQDRYYSKNNDKSNRRESKSYQHGEILDLEDPVGKKTKNKGNKNLRQTRSLDDLDILDERLGLGGGNNFPPPPPPPPGFGNHAFQPGPPMHDNFGGPPMNGPQLPPPPPNMPPFDPNGHNHFPPPPPPPLARRATQPHFDNPFNPDPQFAVHNQYDSMDGEDYQHGPNNNGPQNRTRSKSQRRQSSARRPSVGARRFSQLEDKIDNLVFKMQNWQVGSSGSSVDTREDDSIFSRPQHDGRDRDFSEPSSPTSHFSRGSLERTKSYNNNNTRPRYRSHRYSDADIEPAYSNHRGDDRRYSVDSRRSRRGGSSSSRPKLHHSQTYDDYPSGRGAEPRYLPAPPPRRVTDFDERYDYEEFDDGMRGGPKDTRDLRVSRRRSPVEYDPFQEGYEAGRREWEGRERERDGRRRRMSAVVGGGGGGRSYWN